MNGKTMFYSGDLFKTTTVKTMIKKNHIQEFFKRKFLKIRELRFYMNELKSNKIYLKDYYFKIFTEKVTNKETFLG